MVSGGLVVWVGLAWSGLVSACFCWGGLRWFGDGLGSFWRGVGEVLEEFQGRKQEIDNPKK